MLILIYFNNLLSYNSNLCLYLVKNVNYIFIDSDYNVVMVANEIHESANIIKEKKKVTINIVKEQKEIIQIILECMLSDHNRIQNDKRIEQVLSFAKYIDKYRDNFNINNNEFLLLIKEIVIYITKKNIEIEQVEEFIVDCFESFLDCFNGCDVLDKIIINGKLLVKNGSKCIKYGKEKICKEYSSHAIGSKKFVKKSYIDIFESIFVFHCNNFYFINKISTTMINLRALRLDYPILDMSILSNFPHLIVLDLMHNAIENIKEKWVDLSNFKELRALNLSGNNIGGLGSFEGFMKKLPSLLKKLDLCMSNISNINCFANRNLLNLTKLSLVYNNITSIWSIGFCSSNLRYLDVSYNNITTVKSLVNLSSIKKINFYKNNINVIDIIYLFRMGININDDYSGYLQRYEGSWDEEFDDNINIVFNLKTQVTYFCSNHEVYKYMCKECEKINGHIINSYYRTFGIKGMIGVAMIN